MNTSSNVGDLVEQSTRQYAEIAELLGSLKNQLEDNSTKMIATMLDQFNQMSKDARIVDAQIEEQIRNNYTNFSDTVKAKLTSRQELQRDTLQLIEQTVSKANTIKSYLSSEFLSVRKGRNAISGYKSNLRNQAKIVNRSF